MASWRLRFDTGQRLLDASRRGPAEDVARLKRPLQRQVVEDVGVKQWGEPLELDKAQVLDATVLGDRAYHDLPDDPMRVPERHALAREIVGSLRRERVPGQCRGAHRLLVELDPLH